MDEVQPVIRRQRLRQARSGVTVVELMVACLVLGMLSVMIFFTLQTSQMAQKKLDAADTVQRAHLIARLHLADHLRGARMATPNTDLPVASALRFQKPSIVDGVLQVDALGNQIWTDFFEISMNAQGHLIASTAEGPQVLATLQPGATFEAKALEHKVRVTLQSPEYQGHPPRKTQADFYIAEQVLPGGP